MERLKSVRGQSRLLREGISIAAGQAAMIVGRFLGIRLLTELVTPATFGTLNLLLGVATLGVGIFCTPILQAALRFFPEAQREGRIQIMRRLVAALLKWSTTPIVVALLLGGALWSLWPGQEGSFAAVVLLGGCLVLDVIRTFETNLMNAARRQGPFALWLALDVWARAGGAVAAILMFGPRCESILGGYLAASVLLNLGFLGKRVRGQEVAATDEVAAWTRRLRADFLRYAAPLVPLAVVAWLTGLAPRYFLAGIAGLEEAGIYAAAFGLASQPFIGYAGIVYATLRPVLFDAFAEGDARRKRRVFLIWLGVVAAGSLVGVLFFWAFAGVIARISFGKAFQSAAPLLPWIAAAYAIQGVQQVFESVLYARSQTLRVLLTQGVATVLAVPLYILLIPGGGAKGAALATLLSLGASCAAGIVLTGVPVTFWRTWVQPRGRSDGPPPDRPYIEG